MPTAKFPMTIKRGSVSVKIYRTPTRGCEAFTLSYYQDGVRKRPTFAAFTDAKAEAESIASRLSSAEAGAIRLSSADSAAYMRACELLEPLGVPIEAAAAEFAHAQRRLAGATLSQAVDFYLLRNPSQIPPRPVREVIDEMLAAKKSDGLNGGYLRHLGYDLNKFASAFSCNIGSISGVEIDEWLRTLNVAPRTRNNLRTSIQTLLSFAKSKRYLPKDHDEIESVAIAKQRGGLISIFMPEEMAELLSCATPALIPFLAIAAFAGVRHAEIKRLQWQHVRFDEGIIDIHAELAKTASRRTIPISPNLAEWLAPYRKTSGAVCALAKADRAIERLVANVNERRAEARIATKFAWKRNAARHSFVSYRVAQTDDVAKVALEAGNTPQIVFKNYRQLVSKKQADAWFAIRPSPVEGVLALRAA